MKKQTNDKPIGKLTNIVDNLPSPDELVLKEEKEVISIALSKHSLQIFKSVAKKRGAKYQTMIRKYLDEVADRISNYS